MKYRKFIAILAAASLFAVSAAGCNGKKVSGTASAAESKVENAAPTQTDSAAFTLTHGVAILSKLGEDIGRVLEDKQTVSKDQKAQVTKTISDSIDTLKGSAEEENADTISQQTYDTVLKQIQDVIPKGVYYNVKTKAKAISEALRKETARPTKEAPSGAKPEQKTTTKAAADTGGTSSPAQTKTADATETPAADATDEADVPAETPPDQPDEAEARAQSTKTTTTTTKKAEPNKVVLPSATPIAGKPASPSGTPTPTQTPAPSAAPKRVWVIDTPAWTEEQPVYAEQPVYEDQPVYTEEPIYEEQPVYTVETHKICDSCGEDLTDLTQDELNAHLSAHEQPDGQPASYHTESRQIQTGTDQVQTGTKQVQTGTKQVQTGTKQVQTGTKLIEHPEVGHWEDATS